MDFGINISHKKPIVQNNKTDLKSTKSMFNKGKPTYAQFLSLQGLTSFSLADGEGKFRCIKWVPKTKLPSELEK